MLVTPDKSSESKDQNQNEIQMYTPTHSDNDNDHELPFTETLALNVSDGDEPLLVGDHVYTSNEVSVPTTANVDDAVPKPADTASDDAAVPKPADTVSTNIDVVPATPGADDAASNNSEVIPYNLEGTRRNQGWDKAKRDRSGTYLKTANRRSSALIKKWGPEDPKKKGTLKTTADTLSSQTGVEIKIIVKFPNAEKEPQVY